MVEYIGFDELKARIAMESTTELQKLPYIGPITAWHLAKNLGLDVAKPDRHLVRLSKWLGYLNAADLCEAIARAIDESISVVDLILWRFAADGSMSGIISTLPSTVAANRK